MERKEIDELIKTHDTTEDMIEKAFLSYNLANKIYMHQIIDIESNYSQQAFEITAQIDIQQLISEYEITKNMSKKAYIGYVLCYKYTQAGQFDISRDYGNDAIEIAISEGDYLLTLDLTTALGVSFADQGLYDEARKYFEKSLIYAEKSPVKSDLANAYSNLGNIEYSVHRKLKALEYFTKAVTLLEVHHKEGHNVIQCYSNLATIYLEINKYEEAKRYLKKSLELNKEIQSPDPYLNFGNFYKQIGNALLALGYYKKCLRISLEPPQMYFIIECNFQLGLLKSQKGLYKEAIKHLDEALDLAKIHDFQEHCFKVSHSLGDIYTKLKNYEMARSFYEKALTMLGLLDNDSVKYAFYQTYHHYLFETKQYEEAYKAQIKYYELKERLDSEEQKRNREYLAESFDSEQKTREVEFINQKNKELLVYQNEILRQKEELLKLNEEKDAILLTISHDLKNSLGSINFALDTLSVKEKEIFEHKYLKIIDKNTQQSLALVKEILYSNKIDQEESQLTLYDINKNILTLFDNLNLIAQKKEIELSLDLAEEPLQCMIELEKFDRIIDNICMNAIKFTNSGGTIEIKTQKISDVVQIHIKDSGIGMDETMIKNLFEKFSKAGRKGTSGEESTGLGLYIVKTLVEKIGGSVEVFSEVDKGTEFVIKLPLN